MNFVAITPIWRTVVELFRSLMLLLSSILCQGIIVASDIFVRLGRAEILTTSQVQSIYSRVTLILGVFMIFKLMFTFVQYLLNPDTITDKSKGAGKLIMKCVVVVVLLGICPYIFQQAYSLQGKLLDSNVIGKVIMGENGRANVEDFGYDLTYFLFTSFYRLADEDVICVNNPDIMFELKSEIKASGTFETAGDCLNEAINEPEDWGLFTWRYGWKIDFAWHGLLLLVVSAFVLYFLLGYCISVGVRLIMLAFLQLIAPIPILSYLGQDKDGVFGKWAKKCLSTFLDLFIRLAIIYFVIFIISLLIVDESNSTSLFTITAAYGTPGWFTLTLLKVIVIVSLLVFAKKAPDLLKDLIPGGGSGLGFGLKSVKENLAPMGRALGFGAGAVTGAAVSGIARFNTNRRAGRSVGKSLLGAAGGLTAGLVSGGFNGAKKGNMFKNVSAGVKARRTADNKYNDLITSGGSVLGSAVSKIVDLGGETKAQRANRIIRDMEAMAGFKSSLNKTAEEITFVSSLKTTWENMKQFDNETDEAFTDRKNKAQQHYKAVRKLAQEAALTGNHVQTLEEFKWTDHLGVEHVEKLSNPVTYNFAKDEDDKAYLASMVAIKDQAEDYRKAHNVKYYDSKSGDYVPVGEINSRSAISELSYKSEETKAYLQRQGLAKAEAEDKYVGVDSNASKK